MTEPGIWRFTFDGVVQILDGFGAATIALEIVSDQAPEPIVKARSYVSPGIYNTHSPTSISTIVQVEANDVVRIRWMGDADDFDAVLFSENRDTRWTGTYLGSGVPTPPDCYDGTYEFPGSCRLYYLCREGSISIESCCPGIFSPSPGAGGNGTCIAEDEADVGDLCAPLDICD